MRDLSKTFYPGLKFIKDAYGKVEGWYPDKDITFVLYKAIVIDVKKETQTAEMSVIIPPFSINAKIVNEDVSSLDPQNDEPQWFAPLNSIHNVCLPEKGELIWIIRSSNTREARGYWIDRVNDTDRLNLQLTDSNSFSTTAVYSSEIVSAQNNQQIFSIPARLGDVISQGRSDSYFRHSFNPQNKEGVLEFGIKERRKYDFPSINAVTIGNTKTKTVHLSNSKISDVISISSISSSISSNINLIANVATQIYNISVANNSEEKLYRQVLGEKNTDTLNSIILMFSTLNENLENFVSVFMNHNHIIPEQKFRNIYTISIPPQGGSRNVDVNISFPEVGSSVTSIAGQGQNLILNNLKNSLKDIKNKINSISLVLPNILSKNQFIN